MTVSEKTRTRLVVLNVALWFLSGIAALAVLGGPRGIIETALKPVGEELGGWFGLTLGALGLNASQLPSYEIAVEPRVLHAAELLGRERGPSAADPDPWWFPAKFVADGAAYGVDIRFDGAAATNEELVERSWRVRFRGKDRYRGLRELELTPARSERHAANLMVRETARENGLLAPPGGFATLRINGADAGAFFWSEGDSAAMLERLGYPEGEILIPRVSAGPVPAFLAAGSDSLGLTRYAPALDRSSRSNAAAEQLTRLLALTRNAADDEFERQAPELLDVEKYLTWNALVCIFGDPRADGFPALSWFFDPVSGLLEPIVRSIDQPADATVAELSELPDNSRLTARLLASPEYRALRNRILWQLIRGRSSDVATTADAKLGAVLAQLAKAPGSLIHFGALRDAAAFRRANRTALGERVAALSTALAASQVETRPVLSVNAGTPTLTLEVKPAGLAEILLSELRFELGDRLPASHDPADIRLVDPTGRVRLSASLDPVVIGSSVALRPEHLAVQSVASREAETGRSEPTWTVEFELPFLGADAWSPAADLQGIEVVYRNAVTGEALPPARLLRSDTLAGEFHVGFGSLFRSIDEVIAASSVPLRLQDDEVIIPAGDHTLEETLIVPRSYRLRIEPGAHLRLASGASILIFRGVTALGTRLDPILLRAADPEQPWGSLGVIRAPETSTLAYLTVSGGSRTRFEGIELDGQLSFNASNLLLSDSEVQDARKADGLSVKRSIFEVSRTQFITNDSDGLASEWSQGTISESLFVNNGDDGLDLADSNVAVDDSSFHWMGDKSISAGARSRVSIASTQLSDSEIAIASKEDSRVDVRDTDFRRNRLGFALYRDKPVFGGGSGSVTGGVFARNNRDFSVEPGSNLELIRVHREAESPKDAAVLGSIALQRVVTRSR